MELGAASSWTWCLCAGAVVCIAIVAAWMTRALLRLLWWTPRQLEGALRAQGLRGTRYRFLYGDIKDSLRLDAEAQSKTMPLGHDIAHRVFPHRCQVAKEHGKESFEWLGIYPKLAIIDPNLGKEVLSSKFVKSEINYLGKMLATGVAMYEGEKWAKHRRIINPAFHMEKLKLMMPAFSTCCDELIARWDAFIGTEASCELDVQSEFRQFTGDVISRAAFGSSYEEGRRIFQLQREQAKLLMAARFYPYIPFYRFLPTRTNTRMKEICREVDALLMSMVEQREREMKTGQASNNDDLLGLLLESNMRYLRGGGGGGGEGDSNNTGMTVEDVIQECKLFYFAGHETTSVLLTWTMVVLSMHPAWQIRAREEVLQVFGRNKPDFDGLNRLKIVTMILQEVLRLYPPGATVVRRTNQATKLGDYDLPPGVQVWLDVLRMHHDQELWGEDASEFKPERFADGVSKASRFPGAYLPFGGGPRICVGQNFGMVEAKMALAVVLQHFSFKLSPSYAHAPCIVLILQPQHGAQIILEKL